MFPVDVVEVLREGLKADRREPDGLLHASSHLIGSLRHAMLDVAGAPKIESNLVSDIRMMTGTMWHLKIEGLLRSCGVRVKSEINLTKYMPQGWGGTADWLFWSDEHEAWVLGDLKTIKGEGLRWILEQGAKDEHLWQLSSYWYALRESGIPLFNGFGILYLPMNDAPREPFEIKPVLQECAVLPEDVVLGRMRERAAQVKPYIESLTREPWSSWPASFLTDELAPVQQRVQQTYWQTKTQTFDLKLVGHWSSRYCPFPLELCDCSQQGTTLIGKYDLDGNYSPRKGYENIIPIVAPTTMELNKRRKAA